MIQQLTEFCYRVDGVLGSSNWFMILLCGTGIFFTIYLRLPQIRYFLRGWTMLFGSSANFQGDTTKFQSLTTALSGTVGTGNIAGVALAIHIGGPAAILWMMICAFLGMSIKFTEVTLSHKYRVFEGENGTVAGGPMYYMRDRLKMPWLGTIFALGTIGSCFGTGALPQLNSISTVLNYSFGVPTLLTGVCVSLLIALSIIGGIKRIAAINTMLAPGMTFLYTIGALTVIFYNHENILPSLSLAFSSIFGGTEIMGGFLGASISLALNKGLNRGLFSNEAGQGSSAIVHAAAKTEKSIHEGFVALLEPFIDTIVLCFLTGMVLLSSGAWCEKVENKFQSADLYVIEGAWNDTQPKQAQALADHVNGVATLPPYDGIIAVNNGKIIGDVSLIHSRSLAENVTLRYNQTPYTGDVVVKKGKIDLNTYEITGKSLLHSANLSAYAFTKGWFGEWGKYFVTFGLLLFAFSTAISWSYYGNAAVCYLVGAKYILPYRIVYILSLVLAAVADTTIVWAISAITAVLMTIPNLISLLLLRKDIKQMTKEFDIDAQ